MRGLIQATVASNPRYELFGALRRGMTVHSSEQPLRTRILAKDRQLVGAYPEIVGGPVWPVTLHKITPWANGVEGQLSGDCHGAAVSFFDTRFYANRKKYRPGQTYNFHMAALAYKVGPAQDLEVGVDELGAKVSLKGAHAFMPAASGQNQDDIDDYWFYSAPNGPVSEVEFASARLKVYPITLALPEEFEMRLPLYAAQHVIAPDMASLEPDEDLAGFLWLQGYLSEE